jgi:hypothetical protein
LGLQFRACDVHAGVRANPVPDMEMRANQLF